MQQQIIEFGEVASIFAQVKGEEGAHSIRIDTKLPDLGLDSLAMVALAFMLEERFGVDITTLSMDSWNEGTVSSFICILNGMPRTAEVS